MNTVFVYELYDVMYNKCACAIINNFQLVLRRDRYSGGLLPRPDCIEVLDVLDELQRCCFEKDYNSFVGSRSLQTVGHNLRRVFRRRVAGEGETVRSLNVND